MPVFRLNDSVIVPTRMAISGLLYALVYQMPSGTSVAPTDVLTMSAPMGWASTVAGLVAGTSSDGTMSTPLTVTNYSGQSTEFSATKTIKPGYNTPPYAPGPNVAGQPCANYARRLWKGDPAANGSWTGGTVLTYDPTTQLPKTLSGQGVGYVMFGVPNGLDAHGSPSTEGLWTLVYGDASLGVTSNPSTGHKLTVGLQAVGAWNFVEVNTPGVTSSGTWDGSAWRGITRTYQGSYSGSGVYDLGLQVIIDSTASGGDVTFPSKGNGQLELGIFPPSPANRNVSSPTNWDPLGIDPEYLLKHQGAHCLRWMATAGGNTTFGDSSMVVASDITQRQVNDFLWTKQSTTTCFITKVEPVVGSFNCIVDYQASPQSISANNWHDGGSYFRSLMLCSCDGNHDLRTGDYFTITPTSAAPGVAVRQDGLVLTSGILATGNPVTFTVSDPNPPLDGTFPIQIGAEQFTVTGGSAGSVTATRGTNGTAAAAHSIGDPVYSNFLTAAISVLTDPLVITLSRTSGLGVSSQLQIDSEQVIVVAGTLTATTVSVSRGANGTTKATHAVGAIVYPSFPVTPGLVIPYVTSPTQFVIPWYHTYLPNSGGAALTNPTIEATVNYNTPGAQPLVTVVKPSVRGSVPYEFAAKFTDTIAVARGSKTILWINVGLLATDDLVTEIIANRTIPFIGPLVDVILELSNEVWNSGDPQAATAGILSLTAPNPDPSGPNFTGLGQFVASRQNQVTQVAKAAFTAAGLDSGRVYDFQPGHRQIGFSMADSATAVAYCQANDIPIDYLSMDGYLDTPADVWDIFWTFMPTADGGSAAWDRPTGRRVMMSYFRAWCWFSAYFGSAIAGHGQLLSWYKAAKSVANAGVGSATANTGLGRICYYESATEFLTDPSSFVNPRAMVRDLIYDPNWYATEEAYWAAKQAAGLMYARLMPTASFPDLPSAIPEFSCYYASVYQYGGEGEAWLLYNWQGQQPGLGISPANTMSVPNGTAWSGATPLAQDRLNQSVRAQVAIDWIAASVVTSVGAATTIESGDTLTAVVIAGAFGPNTTGAAAFTERRDALAAIELSAQTRMAVTEPGGIMVGIGLWSPDSDSGLIHPDLVSLASYTIDPREVTEV